MKISARAVIVAIVAAAVLGLIGSPAGAHTGFESSDPAEGTSIAGPVDEIVLQFSGPAVPAAEGFVVLDPQGVIREPDRVFADADETTWTLGFDEPLAGGRVGVRWTVKAPDAHPINGAFAFTVAAAETLDPIDPEPSTSQGLTGFETGRDSAAEKAPTATSPASGLAFTRSSREVLGSSVAGADATGSHPLRADLDEFLAHPGATAPYADALGGMGRLLWLTGIMIGLGGVVFASTVVRHRALDAAAVLRWAHLGGAAIVVGAVAELVAQMAVTGGMWSAATSTATLEALARTELGTAIGLRALGGLLLFSSTASRAADLRRSVVVRTRVPGAVPVGVGASAGDASSQVRPTTGGSGTDTAGSEAEGSSTPLALSTPIVLALATLVASFVFDGHTVTEGDRVIVGVTDVIHVISGGVWAGGVVAMAGILWRRHRHGVRLRALELTVRFSVIAAVALVVAGVAGTVLAVTILDSVSELWSTPWGLLLLAKFSAVVGAAVLGAYNHFLVIPWMNAEPHDDSRSTWLRNMVTGEAAILGIVVAVTALLIAAAS